jgi:hypothetical protein
VSNCLHHRFRFLFVSVFVCTTSSTPCPDCARLGPGTGLRDHSGPEHCPLRPGLICGVATHANARLCTPSSTPTSLRSKCLASLILCNRDSSSNCISTRTCSIGVTIKTPSLPPPQEVGGNLIPSKLVSDLPESIRFKVHGGRGWP